MSGKPITGNDETIEAWNGVLFDKFERFRTILTSGLGIHGDAAMDRLDLKGNERVLDLGCGFGDTTQVLAARVGKQGLAVGVDAATRFIEIARREAEASGIVNAKFVVADAQSTPLGGPFDAAFSRMGVMFFANPVAALRNLKRSLVPGARIAFAVWRKKDENPFLKLVEDRVLEIVSVPEKTEAVTCGPGPFSMASPDVVSAQLLAAGFERPAFERFDGEIFVGEDLERAVDFSMTIGPAGEVIRLAGDEGARRRDEIAKAVREVLVPFAREGGVYGMSSTWLVTARVPAAG